RIRKTVYWCVVHRRTTIALTILAFVLGLGGFKVVEKQFFPESNRPEILLDLWMPEGTSFAAMEAVVHEVEEELSELADMGTISSFVGWGAPRFYLSLDQIFPQPNASQLILTPAAADIEMRNNLLRQVNQTLSDTFPEVRPRARFLPNGPPVNYPVPFRAVGPDHPVVRRLADEVRPMIENDAEMRGVNDDWNEMVKTFRLEVDQ